MYKFKSVLLPLSELKENMINNIFFYSSGPNNRKPNNNGKILLLGLCIFIIQYNYKKIKK